jgi:adenosylcobinamide kinase/adenosylcobinamide-phosphate guanylyltransferase
MVSGPASSGKSRWAEHLAMISGRPIIYLATGPLLPDDNAWQERLERHRRRRPASWSQQEVAGDLAQALRELAADQVALVDSLGTWVACLLELEGLLWQRQLEDLLAAIESCPASLVVVCEETGWGVVPSTASGGRFRDRLGMLQQQLMARSDRAWLVLQGRAIDLLPSSLPVPLTP